jgi:hypothetical protein
MEFCGDRALYVVGPQRAYPLIYEIARQLGGTAAAAIEDFKWEVVDTCDSGYEDIVQQMNHRGEMYRIGRKCSGYRLSTPIPATATVLFVTDDFKSVSEFNEWHGCVDKSVKFLPYVLTLMNSSGCLLHKEPGWSNGFKIISLHQENP